MISVIVPFYQTEQGLFDICVQSILAEHADIELLIIDDGSPVDYAGICDSYGTDVRVKVFHIKHMGVSAARNYGIEQASGNWIMFVDADDFLQEGWYKILSEAILKHDADLICFNGFKDIEGELRKNQFFVKENIDYGECREKKVSLMESALSVGALPGAGPNYYTLGAVYSKLYRTAFLRDHGLRFDPEVSFAEDTLFAMEVYWKAAHIIYIDAYLYHYVLNRQSVTMRFRPGLSEEMDDFFRKIRRFMEQNGLTEELKAGYEARVNFEAYRALNLEFFHPDNPASSREKSRQAIRFSGREPYKSTFEKDLKGENGRKKKLEAWCLKGGRYGFFLQLKACKRKWDAILKRQL